MTLSVKVTWPTALAGLVGLATVAAMLVGVPSRSWGATGPGPIMQPSSSTVTADALPTAQINGVAWSQAIVGGTVYVGGSFSKARPYGSALGSNEVSRANMLAYTLSTGSLVPTFAPVFNAQVLAVAASPDGSKLYVGGGFTTVNGATHNHIAAFSTATGALIPTFTAGTNNSVKSIVATNTTVYAGGYFTAANGLTRNHLAAWTSAGALTAWKASVNSNVNAIVLSPDGSRLVVGGQFTQLNATAALGLGAVSTSSGATLAFAANQVVKDYGSGAAILSLATDGTAIYGTGYNYYGSGNLEGAFSANPTTGAINWIEDCHGDTYGVFAVNGIAYTVSHAHYCANDGGWGLAADGSWQYRHTVAFTAAATGTLLHNTVSGYYDFYGQPAPSIINWFPDFLTGTYTGQGQAAWTVTGNSQYIVEGGEFPAVNNKPQQGLVRFALRGVTGNPGAQGPRLSGSAYIPTLKALSSTAVQVSIGANWDRDDIPLNYALIRNGNTTSPVWSTTVNSQWWKRPLVAFTNTGLSPGATYTYQFRVTDPHGNRITGNTATITMPG